MGRASHVQWNFFVHLYASQANDAANPLCVNSVNSNAAVSIGNNLMNSE